MLDPPLDPAEKDQPAPSGVPLAVGLLLTLTLYLIPLNAALRPVTDWDIWWHLRTGQWIVQQGAVPTTDPFSRIGQEQPWLAYSWLFAVTVYYFFCWLGLQGILLLRLLLILALTAAIHRLVSRREPRPFVAAGLTACVLIALAPLLSERPWLFSMLFYVLTLEAILSLRAGRAGWTVWLLPLLYALWANLHIQFAYGLLLLGIACIAPVLEWLLGRNPSGTAADRAGSLAWGRLVALSIASAAATLLNPYGFRLHVLIVELASLTAAFQWISELQAMPFRSLPDWIVLALFGLAVFIAGRRPRGSAFELLLLACGAFLSFRARRDVWVVALAAAAILAQRSAQPRLRSPWSFPVALLTSAGVLLLTAGLAWRRDLSEHHLEAAVAARFPAEAVAFIEQKGYPGPLFNHFDWGGYVIWTLPRLPVSVDGRADVHRDARLLRSLATWEGRPGWKDDPELTAAQIVLAAPDAPLCELLKLGSRFELVHQDSVALVFIARKQHSKK